MFRAIELRRRSLSSMGSKSVGDKRLINELKKLEWKVNYDQKVEGLSDGSVHRGKGILCS